MARKTLEMMFHGEVYDHEWNGFFRYATRRDWSEPHYEKMLEDNAGLLRNALLLYRITGERGARGDRARDRSTTSSGSCAIRRQGYFYGSQDADEEFYKLERGAAKEHEEPYIDRTCYTSWNAQMISAYLEASWTLDRPDLRDAALGALDVPLGAVPGRRDGIDVPLPATDGAARARACSATRRTSARALLDAAEVTGDPQYIDRAMELAELAGTRRFRDDGRSAASSMSGTRRRTSGGCATGRSRSRTTPSARRCSCASTT